MSLGRTSPTCRASGLLLLLAIALAGCDAGPDAGSPTRPGSTSAATATDPPAYHVTSRQAGRLVPSVLDAARPLTSRRTLCPNPGAGSDCTAPGRAQWIHSVSRSGQPIARGNGFSVHAYVAVAAFPGPRTAQQFLEHQHHSHIQYEGRFSLKPVDTGADTYRPGENGFGLLADGRRGRGEAGISRCAGPTSSSRSACQPTCSRPGGCCAAAASSAVGSSTPGARPSYGG